MMDQVRAMLSDRAVQVYFLVLGLAVHRCVKKYYNSSEDTSKKSKCSSPSSLPIIFSISIIGVTWFLILRFILTHLHTSESYFDDAYKDVLRTDGNYFTSTQLLSWAIVSVVWAADSGCDVSFLLFGFLGAMSASFVLWVPTLYRPISAKQRRGNRQRKTVPISYAISSVIAFVSILKLRPCDPSVAECTPDNGFGSFQLQFRQWLQVLHVILIVPIFVSYVIPKMRQTDSSLLFGLLAIGIARWHVLQVTNGAQYTIPRTDCQISITTDLICCSLITLYAVYKDSMRARGATSASALVYVSAAAIAMPLLSPAAVLAGHLCYQRFHVGFGIAIWHMQRQVAMRRRQSDPETEQSGATWCNLGLWTEENHGYNTACENLAYALGKAAELSSADAVLSCGCGSLDEVRYYKQKFDLRHITGIEPQLSEARMTDPDDFNVRVIRAAAEDLAATEDGVLFPRGLFDKIIALDNIYHYSCKESFFRDSFAMLPKGGKVAVSDIVLRGSSDATPIWAKWALRLMGIPSENLGSVTEYRNKLASLGYDEINVQNIGDKVFTGWDFLPNALLRHIDYVIITANKPSQERATVSKKKVAIIGSGLAGLSAAHYMLSSPEAATLEIDIYEANDYPGLAGNTTLIGSQLVDVPARMAALGYYNRYREILEELDIPTTVVRTDSSFYGSDGHGSHVYHSYDRSSWVNLYNAVFVGGIKRLVQLMRALSKLYENDDVKSSSGEDLTFGEWMQEHLSVSKQTMFKCKDTGVDKQHDLPSLTCYDNPFAYIMVGSLSWMLSCTWNQLANYPADIVLPYCRGLKMDRLAVGRNGQVIRVTPSIKVLERALLYGVNKLQCGSRVAAINGRKVINGKTYDAIICATEAKAVPKVVENCSDVFGTISYYPSTIYLHKDESFMPPGKKNWKCWNVEMSSGRKEPQLTFWLNAFFPDARFDENVFQTWAPTHAPKAELILRRSDFERVVHTKDAKAYIDEINELQGKDGIYFAGSYTVYGMGLLEQALISGKHASNTVLRDIRGFSPNKNGHAPTRMDMLRS
jgi:predicted NAD/FAD-binding protein/cyclopropane fatty-acyl-phospholipid synthase-like methyltransferase